MTFNESPSLSLRKYKWAHLLTAFIMASVSLQFCIAAAVMEGPVMDPADYGPLVTSVKAEWWSWPQLIISLGYLLGVLINGNWYWSPFLRVVCALGNAGLLILFTWLSWFVSPVDPFISACATMAVVNLWLALLNTGDCWRAIKRRYNVAARAD